MDMIKLADRINLLHGSTDLLCVYHNYSACLASLTSALIFKSFAVLNLHGIIDQGELEHILRLRITSHIPLYAAF